MTSELVGGPADGTHHDRPPSKAKGRAVTLIVGGARYEYDWVTLKYRFVPPRVQTEEERYAQTFFR